MKLEMCSIAHSLNLVKAPVAKGVLGPAFSAKFASWALTTAVAPVVTGGVISFVAGVTLLEHRLEETDTIGKREGLCLCQKHERRHDLDRGLVTRIEGEVELLDENVAAVRVARIIRLANPGVDVGAPGLLRMGMRHGQEKGVSARHEAGRKVGQAWVGLGDRSLSGQGTGNQTREEAEINHLVVNSVFLTEIGSGLEFDGVALAVVEANRLHVFVLGQGKAKASD